MSVYQKLNDARSEFHKLQLKKTGKNAFAGYQYFELGDFLLPAMEVFGRHGLCAIVSFEKELAFMRIVSTDPKDAGEIVITSPMGSAALKGCHEVQNIGAVETYQRRYLWVAALEIVEHDALDATTGKTGTIDEREDIVNEAQFAELTTLIEQSGSDTRAFCTFYKIDAIKLLPASKFEHASKALRNKLSPKKESA